MLCLYACKQTFCLSKMRKSRTKRYYNAKPAKPFLCEGEYIDRFSSLYYCKLKVKSVIVNINNENL